MKLEIFLRGEPIALDVEGNGESRRVTVGDSSAEVTALALDATSGTVRVDGRPARFLYERTPDRLRIAVGGECYEFDLRGETKSKRGAGGKGNPETRAPMPGKVLQVTTTVGAEVAAGEPLLILEAMKMENVLSAEIAGTVKELHAKPGEMVEPGKLLVVITPKA